MLSAYGMCAFKRNFPLVIAMLMDEHDLQLSKSERGFLIDNSVAGLAP